MNNRSKRQSIARVFTVLLAALLCFSQLGIFIGCEPAEPPGPLTPPTETPKVHSVVMTYNDAEIEGLLSVDIALGGITVSATVNKDEGAPVRIPARVAPIGVVAIRVSRALRRSGLRQSSGHVNRAFLAMRCGNGGYGRPIAAITPVRTTPEAA